MAINLALGTKVILGLAVVASVVLVSVISVDGSNNGDDGNSTANVNKNAFERVADALFPFPEVQIPEDERQIDYCCDFYQGASSAHTLTDKPVYRPGDVIFMRSIYLDATYLTVPTDSQSQNWFWGGDSISFSVKNQDTDAEICQGTAKVKSNSIAYAQCTIPEGTVGGIYSAQFSSWKFSMSERTIEIRDYARPQLNISIDLDKQSYALDDDVIATIEAKKMNGNSIHGAEVTLQMLIDGEMDKSFTGTIKENDTAQIHFTLPGEVLATASIAVTVDASGIIESKSKTLPVVLDTIKVKYYPEGGYLLPGVENHVYFESFITFDQPGEWTADLVSWPRTIDVFLGDLPAERTTVMTGIKPSHEGRGVFKFTPDSNLYYALSFVSPDGVRSIGTELPEDFSTAMLHVEYSSNSDSIVVDLATEQDITAMISLQRGGNVKFDESTFATTAGEKHSTAFEGISEKVPTGGVITVTVYRKEDNSLFPLVERLVFVNPSKVIHLSVETDQEEYEPGSTVKGSVHAYYLNDAEERVNVSTLVSVTVTDISSLISIEERRLPPNLPTSIFIEDEVIRELRDSDSYLSGLYNGDASFDSAFGSKVDLLLGVQGWRRFITWDYGRKARETYADDQSVLNKIARVLREGSYGLEEMMMDDLAGAPVRKNADGVAQDPTIEAPATEVPNADEDQIEVQFGLVVVGAEYVETYAHELREDYDPNERVDFTETLFWTAGQLTDEEGKYDFEFMMNDSITTFQISADTFSTDGVFGATTSEFTSDAAFYVDMKVPATVTVGDIVSIPVTVTNSKDFGMEVTLSADVAEIGDYINLTTGNPLSFSLQGGQTKRELFTFSVTSESSSISLKAKAVGTFNNETKEAMISKKFSSTYRGIPRAENFGGKMGPTSQAVSSFTLPDNYVNGSLAVKAQIYPSALANMSEALSSLIQEPYGCFEQTSATTFPLVMALQYFQLHNDGSDKMKGMISESLTKLKTGYDRLVSYQTSSGGFEWFGEEPANEALTAYGILQFTEMKKVMGIDENMLSRATSWLLSRKNDEGGFHLSERQIDSFGGSAQDLTDAYIVWALSSAGLTNLSTQMDSLLSRAEEITDPYFIALVALSAYNLGNDSKGKELAGRLLVSIDPVPEEDAKAVIGAETSITRSYGDPLLVETTALSVMAWTKEEEYAAHAQTGMNFLFENLQGGSFWNTQGTILSLQAIVSFETQADKLGGSGDFVLLANNHELGRIAFTKTAQESLNFNELAKEALSSLQENYSAGSSIELTLKVENYLAEEVSTGEFLLPYSTSIVYKDISPDAQSDLLDVTLSVSGTEIAPNVTLGFEEGSILPHVVKVDYKGEENSGMIVAIIGLPGNSEPVFSDLLALKENGEISYYETKKREVILYWRSFDVNSSKSVNFNVKTITPGEFASAPSRVYTYYGTDEEWTTPYVINSFID